MSKLLNGDKSIIKPARKGELGYRKTRGRLVPFSKDFQKFCVSQDNLFYGEVWLKVASEHYGTIGFRNSWFTRKNDVTRFLFVDST